MSKNNDYTTGNLLDYEYFLKNYKLTAIDLSKQIGLENTDLKNSNLYVPVVTLSTKDNGNFTKQLNEGFKRSVYWNE